MYMTVGVAIQRSLLQPVEITIQMNPRPGRDVGTDNFVCMTYVGNLFLGDIPPWDTDYVIACKHHVRDFDTRRCEESIVPADRKSSLFVFYYSVPSAYPTWILAQFGQSPLGRVGSYSALIQFDAFALIKVANESVLILGTLHPICVSTSFGLEFQESVNIFSRETTITRLRIVLCHLIFIYLVHLHNFVSFLHSQTNLVQNPRSLVPFRQPFRACRPWFDSPLWQRSDMALPLRRWDRSSLLSLLLLLPISFCTINCLTNSERY